MSTDQFDWYDDDAGSVVVPEQAAIAVYPNPKGDVVIRQAGQYPDEDSWIIFATDHAAAVADAILRVAGLAFQEADIGEPATPKDRTAAERQRRYRQRNRNGTDRDVTDSDGTLPLLLDNASGRNGGA